MDVTNNQFSDKLNDGWKKLKWPIYCDFPSFYLVGPILQFVLRAANN